VLRLQSVTKRFGARSVLSAVSLEVAAGEYVADRLAEILPGLGESSLR